MTPENTNKESLMAAIRARHSVRRYDPRPIEPEKAEALFSMIGYTHVDLGIVKCHFEIGAGKVGFLWK